MRKNFNGGVYLIEKEDFNLKKFDNKLFKFSFEEDYIEKLIFNDAKLFGFKFDRPFLDIYLVEDFKNAENFLNMNVVDYI